MIKPRPIKKKCPKCRYSKIFYPKSDVVDLSWGISHKCPNCNCFLETIQLSIFDRLFDMEYIINETFRR